MPEGEVATCGKGLMDKRGGFPRRFAEKSALREEARECGRQDATGAVGVGGIDARVTEPDYGVVTTII